MKNLILNSNWQQLKNNGIDPLYFSGVNETLDILSINGNRTCSSTLSNTDCEDSFATNRYDPFICVNGESCINWGYIIRVIDSERITLVAKFYNQDKRIIQVVKSNITDIVTYEFKRVSANFPIPKGSFNVKLSLEFHGKLTACSYYAPTAYFI